jgi:hypothetical protein
VQTWVTLEATAVSATRLVVGLNSSGGANGGWLFVTRTTNAGIEFAAVDGTNITRLSPQYVVQPADLGTVMHLAGWKDAVGIHLAVNGVEVGTGTPMVGYNPGAAVNLTIGARPVNGQNAGGLIRSFGVAGGHYLPSIAEIEDAYIDGLAAKDIVHIAGGTSQAAWSFKGLGLAPASINAMVGADALGRVGSPTFVAVT